MQFTTAAAADAAFYRAFSDSDTDLMRSVWKNAGDVLCVHPLQAEINGFDAVLSSWQVIFAREGRTRILREPLHQSVWPESALFIVREQFEIPGIDARPMPVIATNAYELTSDGWRMILHHGSPIQRDISRTKIRH